MYFSLCLLNLLLLARGYTNFLKDALNHFRDDLRPIYLKNYTIRFIVSIILSILLFFILEWFTTIVKCPNILLLVVPSLLYWGLNIAIDAIFNHFIIKKLYIVLRKEDFLLGKNNEGLDK